MSAFTSLWDLLRSALGSGPILALLWPGMAIAQVSVYHPFPDSNAVWGMTASCTDWNCGTYRYIQDYMAGDTVIDGNAYTIIAQSVSGDFEGCSCTIPEDLGAGFLREDTAARKVYWRFPSATSDTLLYDFTLEVGDTLGGLYGNTGLCAQGIFTVQYIDSILVGNSYRKMIVFQGGPCNPTAIIEGVGSTNGLTACYTIPTSFSIRLDCFTVADTLLYSAPCGPTQISCGDLPSGVQGVAWPVAEPIAFHPNPMASVVQLVCRAGLCPLDLVLRDVTGKAVVRSRITQARSTLDLTALGKGVYMALVFRNGVLVRSEKLVKQ